MSILESIFWHVLGYLMIPSMFVVAFLAAAAVGFLLLELRGGGDE